MEPIIENNCSWCNFCDHFRPLITFGVGDGYCNLRRIRRLGNLPVIDFSYSSCVNFSQTIHNVYNLNELSDIREFKESYKLRDSLKHDILKQAADKLFKEYCYNRSIE